MSMSLYSCRICPSYSLAVVIVSLGLAFVTRNRLSFPSKNNMQKQSLRPHRWYAGYQHRPRQTFSMEAGPFGAEKEWNKKT